jgi:hypothetical protein
VSGILRLEADPGLLTNRRMSIEIGLGLAALSGRRLSMPWSEPVGRAPGPRPASEPARDDRPLITDLWDLSGDLLGDEEWRDVERGGASQLDLHWRFQRSVYLADDTAVPDPGVRDFANGRTTFVRIPETDSEVVRIEGRPLSWYSYFFYATGATRRRLLDAVGGVRLRRAFEELGHRIADDIGRFHVAHIRRTDLVKGIRAYAGVSPRHIADGVADVIPDDAPLLIATEADPESSLFDPIRDRFGEIVFVNDLILRDHRAAFDGLPVSEDNALGAVTQVIASCADRFVGTMGSTFTGLIHRLRLQRGIAEPFAYTVDFTPGASMLVRGAYDERHDGRYTWNRIALGVAPPICSWLREWPEAVVSADDELAPAPARRADAVTAPTLHTVVCTDLNPYGDWQCRLLEHTWHRVAQPGELVRLVGSNGGERPPGHDHARVVTTRAVNDHPDAPGHYPGFNRLWSLQEWLATEQPHGSVLVLDADMVFRAPVRTTTEPGTIVAQEWYRFVARPELERLVQRTARTDAAGTEAAALPPLTWPMIVDAGDLAALLPRWLECTAELRRVTGGWESDMFGLVAAVAESGLRVRYETLGAWTSWPEDFVAGAPIVHYCQPLEHRDGSRLWYKQDWRPSVAVERGPGDPRLDTRPYEPLAIDPNDAQLDYCRDLLHLLDEFVREQITRSAGG